MQAFLPRRDETDETVGVTPLGARNEPTKIYSSVSAKISCRSLIAGPQRKRARTRRTAPWIRACGLERNTGFEPATFALARRRSTS